MAQVRKASILLAIPLVAFIAGCTGSPNSLPAENTLPAQDALPSWNDGSPKQAITYPAASF